MKSTNPSSRSLLSVAVLSVISGTAAAEETLVDGSAQAVKDMEIINVVGQRLKGIELIDIGQLERKQPNDLEDIFRGQPDITVGGSLAVAQKIYVRGVEDTNLNVSIDGVTQAGYLFHHQGRVSIEPELLKQVEIKAGAGTALDGTGALGGAIRFETVDADDLLAPNDNFGALLKAGYYSNTEGIKVSTNLFGRLTDQWSGLLALTQTDTDEIRDGDGNRLADTSTRQDSVLVKLSGQISDNQTLRLSHEEREDDGRRRLRPHFGDFPWNRATEQQSHRKTSVLSHTYSPGSSLIGMETTLYRTDTYLTQTDPAFDDGAGVESIGADIRNTSHLGNHELTYGVEYRGDTGYYDNPDNEETGDVYALYGQGTVSLHEDFTVSYGLRYDRYQLDDSDGQSFSSDGFSPNINASYQLTPVWAVRAGYSTAFRGQQVKEAYLIGFRSNAADLEEETADNFELGVDYELNGLRFSAEVFVSHIDDIVGTVSTDDGRFFDNAGDVENTGFNVSLGKMWTNAYLGLSFSHSQPELDGEPLNDSTMSIGSDFGDTLVVDASYEFPEQRMELGWNGRFVDRLSDVPADRSEKAGYGVHDLYARWLPMVDESVSVTLTVSNVFDKQYFDHGTYGEDPDDGTFLGLPEPGRDVRLAVSWSI